MGLAAGFLILSAGFALLETVAASVPRRSIFRRERLSDLVWWFFTPTVTKAVSGVSLAVAIGAVTFALGGLPRPGWFQRQPAATQVVELLVAADMLGYWSHRLFHRGALWRIHAVHHSSTDLDWLAASRVHPLNEIISRLFQLVPLYLAGFRGEALAALVPFLTLYAIFIHANVKWDFGPLRYVIASPVFHRWHHTSEEEGLDKNFAGLFPWIDLLFGTFYMPRGRQPERFGVAGEAMPESFLAQLAYPFGNERARASVSPASPVPRP